jgi:uncharacterized protein YlxP (DUF503 family)
MGNQNALKRSATSYTRYRLFVVISDVRELVASAGGWICDRIQAGWDVSVAVTEPHDLRPLQILGITTVVTDQEFEPLSDRGEVAAIAFAAEAFDRDELLRRQVLKALDQGATEINIWGKTLPIGLEGRVHRLQHRLSVASRAFKAHAVAAASIPGANIGATEDLYCSVRWYDASVDSLREDA